MISISKHLNISSSTASGPQLSAEGGQGPRHRGGEAARADLCRGGDGVRGSGHHLCRWIILTSIMKIYNFFARDRGERVQVDTLAAGGARTGDCRGGACARQVPRHHDHHHTCHGDCHDVMLQDPPLLGAGMSGCGPVTRHRGDWGRAKCKPDLPSSSASGSLSVSQLCVRLVSNFRQTDCNFCLASALAAAQGSVCFRMSSLSAGDEPCQACHKQTCPEPFTRKTET